MLAFVSVCFHLTQFESHENHLSHTHTHEITLKSICFQFDWVQLWYFPVIQLIKHDLSNVIIFYSASHFTNNFLSLRWTNFEEFIFFQSFRFNFMLMFSWLIFFLQFHITIISIVNTLVRLIFSFSFALFSWNISFSNFYCCCCCRDCSELLQIRNNLFTDSLSTGFRWAIRLFENTTKTEMCLTHLHFDTN